MTQASLRVRLTIIATTVCVAAVALAGFAARRQLERSLIDTAFDTAETALADAFFLDTGSADRSEVLGGVTRFAFADGNGETLDADEFASMIDRALARELLTSGFVVELPVSAFELSPDFAMAFGGEAEQLILDDPVQAAGDVERQITTEELIITQPIAIGTESATISVITPRQPLDDSIGAFTRFLSAMVVGLAGLVAAATWIVSSRVLRPVEAIRRQVETTNADRLDHHVPRSGNGDEIDRLAGTMNDMLDRLRRSSEEQRRFVSDASHELRSPITATLATLETTTPTDASERWEDVRAVLTTEQERLAHLVDDLLLLASMDEAGRAAHGEPIDLDELLLAEARRNHPTPVHVRVVAPHRIDGRASMVRRCVSNLVENAARHAASSVELTLDTNVDGDAVVHVDDDGPGIPVEQLETIFERFTRLDDARHRRDGGAGLGLAIAREIAELHGGTLTAQNGTDIGARFTLTLPTAE